MAACDSTVSGYSCELFVSPVPEDFKCGLCKKVAREPYLADCCGEHYCKTCVDRVIEDKKPCPSCKEIGFSVLVNKRIQKKILALEVQCAMKDRGCEWAGKLEHLDAHLDLDSGSCEYVDVKCPNKCDQPVQKHHLATHLANECPKRDFFCQYCNFTATYEVVCNDHWPVCQFLPIPCPNGCEIVALERGDLDAHLQLCSLEEVKCDFSHAGCNVELVREKMEKHLADNLQRHMLMMNKAVREEMEVKDRRIEQLEGKLEEKAEQVREIKEELRKQDEEMKAKVTVLEHQLQETGQRVEELGRRVGGPVQLTVPNIKELMGNMKGHNCPPMYTHSGGYMIYYRVRPDGLRGGRGTHVSAWPMICKGENDDRLKWPADITITLQLLNQHRDQDHVTLTERYQWKTRTSGTSDIFQFIAHEDLNWNAAKQTQYLKNDCLQFRITKIQVHSF